MPLLGTGAVGAVACCLLHPNLTPHKYISVVAVAPYGITCS